MNFPSRLQVVHSILLSAKFSFSISALSQVRSLALDSTLRKIHKKKGHFSVPNNSECKRKMFYYPSCFKVSKVSVLGMYMCDFKIGFKEKV